MYAIKRFDFTYAANWHARPLAKVRIRDMAANLLTQAALAAALLVVAMTGDLQGVDYMANKTKWFNLAKGHLKSNDVASANQALLQWAASKSWKPDRNYLSVVAEISERSGKQDTAAVCDKQARQLNLEATK